MPGCGVCGLDLPDSLAVIAHVREEHPRGQARCSCKTGYASDPNVHNNQVRTYGRCSCECHGRR